jgi:hypothetical protein
VVEAEVNDIYAKHRDAIIAWPGRLRGMRFLGVYCRFFNDAGEPSDYNPPYMRHPLIERFFRWRVRGEQLFYITYVWPWRWGWEQSQMYETLFLGPCYLLWTWA